MKPGESWSRTHTASRRPVEGISDGQSTALKSSMLRAAPGAGGHSAGLGVG